MESGVDPASSRGTDEVVLDKEIDCTLESIDQDIKHDSTRM